jgi:hypothetical protein
MCVFSHDDGLSRGVPAYTEPARGLFV